MATKGPNKLLTELIVFVVILRSLMEKQYSLNKSFYLKFMMASPVKREILKEFWTHLDEIKI